MAKRKQVQITKVNQNAQGTCSSETVITEDAAELVQWLVKFCERKLEHHYHAADVVNGMMVATISIALEQICHHELSDWLRVISQEIDAQQRKPSMNDVY